MGSVSHMQALAQIAHRDHVDNLVAAACRLLGKGGEVRSIRVVPGSRPTYDELNRYQEWAHDCQVRLSVDGQGMITVRPNRT